MHVMMHKYEEMKQKLEFTRLTLEHTAIQIDKHDIKRAEQIRSTVTRLKEKAANCSEILRKKREREERKISSILSGDTTEIDQIASGGNIIKLHKDHSSGGVNAVESPPPSPLAK